MVVVLGVALLIGGALARRFPVAPALVLLLIGVLIGFAPAIRRAQLPPQVVLLLFLPALLYWESLTTSLREIRSNLRVVVLASTGAGRRHRRRGGRDRARARPAVGAGLGARRRGGARPTRPRSACWPAACRAARSPCCAPRAWSTTAPRWSSTAWPSASRPARSTSARCTSRWLLVLAYGGGVLAGGLVGLVELAAAPPHGRPDAGEHRRCSSPRSPRSCWPTRSTRPACWRWWPAGCS